MFTHRLCMNIGYIKTTVVIFGHCLCMDIVYVWTLFMYEQCLYQILFINGHCLCMNSGYIRHCLYIDIV